MFMLNTFYCLKSQKNRHQILMINDKQWRNVRKRKKIFRLTHMPWHYALFVSSRHICLYVCTVCVHCTLYKHCFVFIYDDHHHHNHDVHVQQVYGVYYNNQFCSFVYSFLSSSSSSIYYDDDDDEIDMTRKKRKITTTSRRTLPLGHNFIFDRLIT